MLTTSEIPGTSVDRRHKKYGLIDMSYDALAKLMDLPREASIVSIKDIDTNNSIRIKIVHTGIKDIQEGSPLPEISVGQVGWDRVG